MILRTCFLFIEKPLLHKNVKAHLSEKYFSFLELYTKKQFTKYRKIDRIRKKKWSKKYKLIVCADEKMITDSSIQQGEIVSYNKRDAKRIKKFINKM